MNSSPSRILNLPLEESNGQYDQQYGKSGQNKNIRIDAREPRIFQEQRLKRVNGVGKGIDVRNPSQPHGKSLDRVNSARRKIQQCMQHSKHRSPDERISDADA